MKIIIQHIAHEQKAFYRSKLFPLWSDLEIFDIPSSWLPAPIDRITAQFASVRDLVERVVIFEFNHYQIAMPLINWHCFCRQHGLKTIAW